MCADPKVASTAFPVRPCSIKLTRNTWLSVPPETTSYPLSIKTLATVSYTHLRAHETEADLVCRLLLEKKLNSAIFPGIQGGPLMHIIAAKAVAFKEAMSVDFKSYQKQVVKNARAMASVFMERGYDVVSGGTDNHVFLVSFIEQGLTGKAVDACLLYTSPSPRDRG